MGGGVITISLPLSWSKKINQDKKSAETKIHHSILDVQKLDWNWKTSCGLTDLTERDIKSSLLHKKVTCGNCNRSLKKNSS